MTQNVVEHDESEITGQMNEMESENFFSDFVCEIELAFEQALYDGFDFPTFAGSQKEIQEKNRPATRSFKPNQGSVEPFRTQDPKPNARNFVNQSQNQENKNSESVSRFFSPSAVIPVKECKSKNVRQYERRS